MSKRILIPIPKADFDPTEVSVPWQILRQAGVETVFSTPGAKSAQCDLRMLDGTGLGPLASILAADKNGRMAYKQMSETYEFNHPISWSDIDPSTFDGVLLPGGHAKGMREYLESSVLQACVSKFFEFSKPVGAICHGVVLASRSQTQSKKSVLFGRKTTALLATQELTAWLLTSAWLGSYYRTYPQTVEAEVKLCLASENDFLKGPLPLFRDSNKDLTRGFVVQDANYISARWPGDSHLFGHKFLELL